MVVSKEGISGTVSDGVWQASIEACKSAFNTSHPCPSQGKYTFMIESTSSGANVPAGFGYGTVTIDSKGTLKLSGKLPDGTAITQSTKVDQENAWPFYQGLYSGRGCAMGWAAMDENANEDLSASLAWVKLPSSKATQYSKGFAVETIIHGASYTAPSSGQPMLSWSVGAIRFSDGGLTAPFANSIEITSNNKVKNLGENKLTLAFTPSTGLFKGSVTVPGTNKSLSFGGAVLKNSGDGYGLFPGTGGTGAVMLEPDL